MARSTARTLGWTIVLALATAIVLGAIMSAGELEAFPLYALISLLYGVVLGLPAMFGSRWLRTRLARRSQLAQWVAHVSMLIAIIVLGTLVVRAIMVMAGLISVAEMWSGMLASFEISVAIGIPATAGAVVYARLQSKLRDHEAEKQRAVAAAIEARLASLESRTRPHFLFNALNSAMALIPEDPARAERILERLSGLLRASLDVHASLVPLRDELAVVVDYLEIERERFGARLVYELEVPEDLRATEIPPFAVQTLVENSVKYAVSPRKQGAKITVRAHRIDDRLVIDVVDDGPGFTGPSWIEGHGLDSLRARLDAVYGAAATLVAPASCATGAAVSLQVPLR